MGSTMAVKARFVKRTNNIKMTVGLSLWYLLLRKVQRVWDVKTVPKTTHSFSEKKSSRWKGVKTRTLSCLWCWINKSYDSQYKRILHVFQLNCKLISFYKLFLRSWCMVCPAMTPDRAPPTSLWSLGIMVNNVWSDKHWLRSPHYWVTLTQQTRDIIISAASEHTEPWLASLVRCWPPIGQYSGPGCHQSSDRQR